MEMLSLSPRLALIAGLVSQGAAVADVGTDHGFIPAWLIQRELAKTVVATDINKLPLNHAIELSERYGIRDKIKFVLCDGLAGLEPNSVDTVIIAGMGGEMMISILSAAEWTKSGVSLILQPQSKQPELRQWLAQNGYAISSEHLVRDAGKMYQVVCASAGEMQAHTAAEGFVGKLELHQTKELLLEHIEDTCKMLGRVIKMMSESGKQSDGLRLKYLADACDGMMDMKRRIEDAENQ